MKGFGCIEGEYPEKAQDISPVRLEELTGLSVTSLTPKERTTYWRLAGILVCATEYFAGVNLGIDPLVTLIPFTFFLLGIDQFFYKGAVFETAYRTLIPEYGKKIISHEAGHFLVAYLLGLPVRGCVTNAWDARKNPGIEGQAGTIFFDSKLTEEIDKQQVTRASLDRLSVVVMAGIGAEALVYGRSEGGASDEQSLIRFLTTIQPPWNILRIQGQARWAVTQAILLIKEHRAAYDALVNALEEKKSIGDCVIAIEENLPSALPSAKRVEERRARKMAIERDSILRYIQRMTWSVGGIDESTDGKDESAVAARSADTGATIEKPAESLNQDVIDFTNKIRMMEEAIRAAGSGVADNAGDNSSAATAVADFESELVSIHSNESSSLKPSESISKSVDAKSALSIREMLTLHRGYQIKQLENISSKMQAEVRAYQDILHILLSSFRCSIFLQELRIDRKLRELHDSLDKASVVKK